MVVFVRRWLFFPFLVRHVLERMNYLLITAIREDNEGNTGAGKNHKKKESVEDDATACFYSRKYGSVVRLNTLDCGSVIRLNASECDGVVRLNTL